MLKGKGGDDSPYGDVTLCVDKQTYVPMKVEYPDKAGKPFKRYQTQEAQGVQGPGARRRVA